MSVTKLKAFNSSDVMKTEEGNDSLDTIIRQAIGKEPLLSFSRHEDNPVKWIQLLNAFDQQELPGRPLLSPVKMQMQKCEKCSREFFSTINYRRHIRAYHRLKRLEKDFTKNRELLAAFWDKLSSEEAIEVVSFKNAQFEEVPGSTIIKNLTALIRKPGFSVLPLTYLKTGSVLLDIVQGRPSKFPLFSRELFDILDDASEKTFLCGTAASMQKYIFDGEPAKISLETKNLVACISFLVEQKLVKAWLADKDAESLRYQKLLVEEEEAAQKRQAELLERKRQKKLRQKEQRAKEQGLEEKESMEDGIAQMLDIEPSVTLSNPSVDCNTETHDPDILPGHISPSSVAFQHSNTLEDKDLNVEQRKAQKSGRKQLNSRRHLLLKSQRLVRNGFHHDHNSQATRILAGQTHGSSKQLRSAPVVNVHKVWSRKPKLENDGDRWKVIVQKEEAITSADQLKSHEVLIGSISVSLGNCSHEDEKCDSTSGMDSVTVKIWRPVSGNGYKGPGRVQNFDGESESEMDGNDQILVDENNEGIWGNSFLAEGSILPANGMPFSSDTAKAFLLQRWKEALMAEHVKLVLSPIEGPQDHESPSQLSNLNKSKDLADEEKQFVASKILGSHIAGGVTKAKFREKPEKSVKLKYISKQRDGQ